jgi:hypothetical protein
MSKKKEENLLQEIKKKLKIKEEEVNELKVGMRGDGGERGEEGLHGCGGVSVFTR